jgi:peptidoglycan/LPS O-acetylase OafA/YrhL
MLDPVQKIEVEHSAPKASPHEDGRMLWLDSLRGVGALAVAYLHVAFQFTKHDYFGASAWQQINQQFYSFLDLGKFGVVLFFCVSGFVIPFSLTRDKPAPVSRFVISRFFRLYPAYWLTIPFGVFFYTLENPHPADLTTILANLTMGQSFVGKDDLIGLYWTLQIELIFYALCLGMFILGWLEDPRKRESAGWGFLAVTLLIAAVRLVIGARLPVAVAMGLSLMFWASVWRAAVLTGDQALWRAAWRLLAGAVVLFPLIALMAYSRNYGYGETPRRYIISYGVALTVFTLCTTVLRLKFRPLYFLGKISYSLYLVHLIVYWCLLTSGLQARALSVIHPQVYILLYCCLAVAVAAVVHRWVETPGVALGRRVYARVTAGSSARTGNR